MKHKISKVLIVVVLMLAICMVAVGCNDQNKAPQKYTVTYVLGDGVQGTAPTQASQVAGAKFAVAASTGLTNEGFTFGGWSYGGKTYQAGDEFTMPASNVQLVAIWNEIPAPTTYAVTYNIGEAQGTAPTQANQAAGAKFEIAASTGLTNEGFTFGGWSFDGQTYQAGDEFTMPAKAVTFVAIWNANQPQPTPTYAVTYNIGTAQGTAPTQANQEAGAKFEIAASTGLTNEGYTFGGWTFDGQTYQAGDEFTMPAKAVEFVAIWNANQPQPVTHTVTFQPNNGSATWTATVTHGQTVARPQTDPTGENAAVFRYWSTDAGEYNFDTAVTKDITLEAIYGWRVSYNVGEGATGSIASQVVRKNTRIFLADSTGLSNGDKIFGGWKLVGDTEDYTYSAGAQYMVTSNVTFVAVWNDAQPQPTEGLSVTFATQFYGEGTAPATITGKKAGDVITLPENTFTVKAEYAGYVFIGWYADSDANTLYQPSDTYTMQNTDVKFTAKWDRGKFSITYKAGEHMSGSDYVLTNINGGKIDLLYDLTGRFTVDSGYTFVGWKIEGSTDNQTYLYDYALSQNVVFVGYSSVIINRNDSTNKAQVSIDVLGGYGLFATLDRDGYAEAIEEIGFALDGETATITLGNNTFVGTYSNNNLEITITYGGTNYVFGFSAAQKYAVTVIKSTVDSTAAQIQGTIPTIENKAANEQFTIPADTFTRVGYTLTGWRVYILDTTENDWVYHTHYDVDEPIVMPAMVIRVEPMWTARKITVSFNANGGSGEMSAIEVASTDNFTYLGAMGNKLSCQFTAPAGMEFDGWATSANGTKLENGIKFNTLMDSNYTVTLYAVWKSTAPDVYVNPVIAMQGNWSSNAHTLTIIAVADATAESTIIGYAVMDGNLACQILQEGGVAYIASAYNYDISYTATLNGGVLTLTNYDSSVITFENKNDVTNAPISVFTGKWSKPLSNGSQKWIITDTNAYYNNSLAQANHMIIGNYLVIEYESAGYSYAYVMTKEDDRLVGFYLAPEYDPAQVTFEQGDYIVLTVDGVPNQVVNSGAKPDADKVATPEAPDGKMFSKWVIAGTETEFSFDTNMTEDVNIEAVFVDAAFTGKTYTGNCTTPTEPGLFGSTKGGETYVKFEVDFDNNKVTYYLSDNTSNTVDMSDDSTSANKPDNYGSDASYFSVQMHNRWAYYLLINADQTKLMLCNLNDEPLTNGEFTEQTGGGSDAPEYQLVALKDVTDQIFTFEDKTQPIYSTATRSYVGVQVTWNAGLGYRIRFVSNLTSPATNAATINIQDVVDQDYQALTFQQDSKTTNHKITFGFVEKDGALCMVIEHLVISNEDKVTEPITLYLYTA